MNKFLQVLSFVVVFIALYKLTGWSVRTLVEWRCRVARENEFDRGYSFIARLKREGFTKELAASYIDDDIFYFEDGALKAIAEWENLK